MEGYKMIPLNENVEEMFIGPFGSSLKNECFVDVADAFCMVYEQKHAIQKTMDVETRYVDEKKYRELKRFNVRGGDILVSCRGTIGETYVVPDDAPLGIMHPSIMKIRLKVGVYDKYYFDKLLKVRLKKHEAEANGSGIKMAISAIELGKELFPVPSLEEQEKIKDVLLRTEQILFKRKEELVQLDNLIKSRFVEMFGDPVSDSMNWGIKPLKSLLKSIRYGTSTPPEFSDEGYAFIRATNIKNGGIVEGDMKYISQGEAMKIEKCKLEGGEILIVRSGVNAGDTCVVTEEYIGQYAGYDMILVLQDDLHPVFFNVLVNTDYMEKIIKPLTRRAAQPHLNSEQVQSFPIIQVPYELQKSFAIFVQQIDKLKVEVQKSLDETQQLMDSLMQKYFG